MSDIFLWSQQIFKFPPFLKAQNYFQCFRQNSYSPSIYFFCEKSVYHYETTPKTFCVLVLAALLGKETQHLSSDEETSRIHKTSK